MRVMSCNIRFASSGSDHGPRQWVNRKDLCINTILKRNPDIICLQECHNDQLADFIAEIGDRYDNYYGISYPGNYFPENVIFYRKGKFRSLGTGAWHLSEKPHVCGTKGWNSECVRFVNWVLLDGPFGRVRVINTHFDHASQLAREKAAEMINEDMEVWGADYPQILTGDLNCDPANKAIQILESAGWVDSMPEKDRFTLTCHEFQGYRGSFDFGICGQGRMDYVFTHGNLKARDGEIIYDAEGDMFPSDHYFVSADIDYVF
ncbi:MAG: endonuclease/exonuclease/phosphatase family protein [Lentisphaerae bacterium]|nr:endonuclease/exonuclease/phosphatase family protein [Lentisphaerota bacterium]